MSSCRFSKAVAHVVKHTGPYRCLALFCRCWPEVRARLTGLIPNSIAVSLAVVPTPSTLLSTTYTILLADLDAL
eukprot:7783975-Pyramimonas_sp.AAC.1